MNTGRSSRAQCALCLQGGACVRAYRIARPPCSRPPEVGSLLAGQVQAKDRALEVVQRHAGLLSKIGLVIGEVLDELQQEEEQVGRRLGSVVAVRAKGYINGGCHGCCQREKEKGGRQYHQSRHAESCSTHLRLEQAWFLKNQLLAVLDPPALVTTCLMILYCSKGSEGRQVHMLTQLGSRCMHAYAELITAQHAVMQGRTI